MRAHMKLGFAPTRRAIFSAPAAVSGDARWGGPHFGRDNWDFPAGALPKA